MRTAAVLVATLVAVMARCLFDAAPASAACCRCDGCPDPADETICSSNLAPPAFPDSICDPLGCTGPDCSESATCGTGSPGFSACEPLGACCGTATGCAQISAAGCELLGGRYQGDGTTCAGACGVAAPATSGAGTVAIVLLILALGLRGAWRASASRGRAS
jgi:hypothetical protein